MSPQKRRFEKNKKTIFTKKIKRKKFKKPLQYYDPSYVSVDSTCYGSRQYCRGYVGSPANEFCVPSNAFWSAAADGGYPCPEGYCNQPTGCTDMNFCDCPSGCKLCTDQNTKDSCETCNGCNLPGGDCCIGQDLDWYSSTGILGSNNEFIATAFNNTNCMWVEAGPWCSQVSYPEDYYEVDCSAPVCGGALGIPTAEEHYWAIENNIGEQLEYNMECCIPYNDYSNGACTWGCAGVGDVNCDGIINILDIVPLANCILAETCNIMDCDSCDGSCAQTPLGVNWPCGIHFANATDVNGDGEHDVRDIVVLANCIVEENCCDSLGNDDCNGDAVSRHRPPRGVTRGEQQKILKDILNVGENLTEIIKILKKNGYE